MPSAASAATLEDLIDAYRTLGVELRASETAIRLRYRELAQLHHPDKWPHGSPEQAEAANRMRVINAAHELIEHAPLRFHQAADTPLTDFNRPPELPSSPSRPLGVMSETLLRFAAGIGIGGRSR